MPDSFESFNLFLPPAEGETLRSLERLLQFNLDPDSPPKPNEPPLWREDFFNFQTCKEWQGLNKGQKLELLGEVSQGILGEAIAIERAGIFYGAKMNLLAKTTEERCFYATMAHEEALHLRSLLPFFTAKDQSSVSSFALLIANIVKKEERIPALLLIQILLEGWGISYYQSLVGGTDHSAIQQAFTKIIKDESRHHAAGLILLKPEKLNLDSQILQYLEQILGAIRVGPYTAAAALIKYTKPVSSQEIETMLESMDAYKTTQIKLQKVESLLSKALDPSQLLTLREKSFFEPFSLEQMAKLLFANQ